MAVEQDRSCLCRSFNLGLQLEREANTQYPVADLRIAWRVELFRR